MKILRLHLDGYGRFADEEVGPLGPGLTLVVGPNEAGKSTLLDFVRGVLFGFADRRTPRAFHEPLRGGRHGGSVSLCDDRGGVWTLERHLPGNKARLYGPDGAEMDESALHDLLGRADEKLFASIFAFGLDELASFDSLNADQVRDLIFSAGVLGAGRSATAALKVLDEQRDLLVRRRSQTRASHLLTQRDELRAGLRVAHSETDAYTRLDATRRARVGEIERLRTEMAGLVARQRELDLLQSCWAQSESANAAAAELAGRGPVPAEYHELIAERAEIGSVVLALSGHQRMRREDEIERERLRTLEDKLAEILPRIGLNADACRDARVDAALVDRVGDYVRREQEAVAASHIRDAQLADARRRCDAAVEELERAERGGIPTSRELDHASTEVGTLRGLLGELSRVDGELRQDEQEQRLAALAPAPRPSTPIALVAALAATLVFCGALVNAFGIAHHRGDALALALSLVGVLVLGAFAALQWRSSRTPPVRDEVAPVRGERQERRSALLARIGATASELGLPERPEEPDLAALGERIESDRDRRREVDGLTTALESASAAVREAERASADLHADVEELAAAVDATARDIGLTTRHSAMQLRNTLALIGEAQDRQRAIARLDDAVRARGPELDAYVDRVRLLATRYGTGDIAPRDLDALSGAVRSLAELVDAADHDLEARRVLAVETDEGRAFVDRAIEKVAVDGAAAERLRLELRCGTTDGWKMEELAVEVELRTFEEQLDSLRRAEVEIEHALAALLGSQEIAALETDLASVEAQLDAVLEEWATLALSGQLLRGTLARYEAERQPVVISRAALLFSQVTGGEYTQLIARDRGGTSRRIDAVTPGGVRVDAADLSRGTAEQLYLCLRLAYAANFAERSGSLPLVLDDVLVNFDPERARAMAGVIADVAADHQIVVFTCHPHLVECFTRTSASTTVLELRRA